MTDLEKVKEYLDNALDYLKLVDKGTYGNSVMSELVKARTIVENLAIADVSNCKIADDKLPTFDLTDIIQFGYYVRKNPNVVMRENYLNWKELPKDKPFSK